MTIIIAAADPLASAIIWIQQALLGSVATAAGVVAVAATGAMMLSGRIDRRRAALTIVGCFVIFGASAIGAGLVAPGSEAPPRSGFVPAPLVALPPTPPRADFDPYAGAAPLLRPTPKSELRQRAGGDGVPGAATPAPKQ